MPALKARRWFSGGGTYGASSREALFRSVAQVRRRHRQLTMRNPYEGSEILGGLFVLAVAHLAIAAGWTSGIGAMPPITESWGRIAGTFIVAWHLLSGLLSTGYWLRYTRKDPRTHARFARLCPTSWDIWWDSLVMFLCFVAHFVQAWYRERGAPVEDIELQNIPTQAAANPPDNPPADGDDAGPARVPSWAEYERLVREAGRPAR
ncbi:hypothetical protein QBC37DRAFT_405357 [Rhypophila decipiens]|uniref:Uncharacterized protein n=1 Tax=Rhypophila decipiens TaxID=261697 RepID=A0AAN6XXA8_9PEZI|nr:hypothetical protein QBC37DRAFT_405357 [Rhypophila decipiens]